MASKLNRNDSCHCGSGKKYKNCCMDKDTSGFKSKAGLIGVILLVVLGVLFLSMVLRSGSGVDCPPGTTWSPEHQHCH